MKRLKSFIYMTVYPAMKNHMSSKNILCKGTMLKTSQGI